MKRRDFLTVAPALAVTAGSIQADTNVSRITVRDTQDLMDVQSLIGTPQTSLSAKTVVRVETVVHIEARTYVLQDTFRIAQSNFAVIAEPGTKVILADHVNKPMLAIGSQEEVPSFIVENVYISGIVMDGNKENQDTEYETNRPWIRNNGIDVRAVKRLTIENVAARNNRSGGVVVSWGSSDVHILNSEFDNNSFDGVAYYDSRRIYTNNSSMKNNNNAGVSVDNNFVDSAFSNCIIDSNGDVGIFARFSKELRFNNCAIKNSGSWAAFLSHDENNNGIHDTMFSVCQLLNNSGGFFMGSVTEDQSSFNSIIGCVFRGNERNGRDNIQTSGSHIWGVGNLMMG